MLNFNVNKSPVNTIQESSASAGKLRRSLTAEIVSGLFIFSLLLFANQVFSASTPGRTYSRASWDLSVEGKPVSQIKGVAGGVVSGQVAVQEIASSPIIKKSLSNIGIENFNLEIGLLGAGFAGEWLSQQKTGRSFKNGVLSECDYNGNVLRQTEFSGATLSQIDFPGLDAASKERVFIGVSFDMERVNNFPGTGKCKTGAITGPSPQALASNFRFQLNGLDANKVRKIEEFSISFKGPKVSTGPNRIPSKGAGKFQFPNLRVYLSVTADKSWAEWYDSFVIKGNSGDAQEKEGSIILLDQTLTKEIARIDLKNVGIFRYEYLAPEAGQLGMIVVDLYVENMDFVVK